MGSNKERRLLKTMTESLATRSLNLPAISPETNTPGNFAESCIMPRNSNVRLHTSPTRFISAQKILQCFIRSVGKLSCFSNGSSSICISRPFGVTPKMLSGYRSTAPSALTALLLSPNMTVISTVACLMYSAFCEVLLSTRHRSENCSKNRSTIDLKYVKTSAFNLA